MKKKEELLLESLNREIEANKKIKTNKREIDGFSFDFVWDRHNLKSLGASYVEGLFLSRTYHHSNEILEANQKDNTEKNVRWDI